MSLEMRTSLCTPIPEIFVAARRLSDAVDAHLGGDFENASRLLREADCPKVWAYIDAGWGKGARARYAFVEVAGAPPLLLKPDRPTPRMPTSITKAAVKLRDKMHCRFCGMPVIDAAIRMAIVSCYPDVVGWPRTDVGKHAAFTCMWLQYDHVLPNSRGGDSSLENIVLTCAACNFGRMETTLEEGRLAHPLQANPQIVWSGYKDWDGLERFSARKQPDGSGDA